MEARSVLDFDKVNALLNSKFEEIIGALDFLLAKNKSLKNKIEGLEFEIDELKEKMKDNEKKIAVQKNIIRGLEEKSTLKTQNFKIPNKFIRIVSDINESEFGQPLGEVLQGLIDEVDDCLIQLKSGHR